MAVVGTWCGVLAWSHRHGDRVCIMVLSGFHLLWYNVLESEHILCSSHAISGAIRMNIIFISSHITKSIRQVAFQCIWYQVKWLSRSILTKGGLIQVCIITVADECILIAANDTHALLFLIIVIQHAYLSLFDPQLGTDLLLLLGLTHHIINLLVLIAHVIIVLHPINLLGGTLAPIISLYLWYLVLPQWGLSLSGLYLGGATFLMGGQDLLGLRDRQFLVVWEWSLGVHLKVLLGHSHIVLGADRVLDI